MNPDTDTLTLIRTSFAGRDELIERAFRESQPFQTLCEDYRECVAALHCWKQVASSEPSSRWEEYAELLTELDREVRTWLEAMDTGASRSSRNSP